MGCCSSNRNEAGKMLEQAVIDNSPTELASTKPLLDESEQRAFLESCGELGPDPTSKHFVKRTKNVGYVLKTHGRWFRADNTSSIFQHANYNDFTGGFRRDFKALPNTFLECAAVQKVLDEFKATFNIPDGKFIVVNVQRSHLDTSNSVPAAGAGAAFNIHATPPNQDFDIVDDEVPTVTSTAAGPSKHVHQVSITGQGIHSDGLDSGMLVVLERNNICGAETSVYHDVVGTDVVMSPFVLKAGHALTWQDNKVYHYVSPASLVDRSRPGERTVLVLLYPGILVFTGEVNENNTLGKKIFDPSKQLRYQPKHNSPASGR